MQRTAVLAGLILAVVGCGGTEQKVQSVATHTPAAVTASSAPSTVHSAAPDDDEMVPEEVAGHSLTLAPLEHRGALPLQILMPIPDTTMPAGFPSATADDGRWTAFSGCQDLIYQHVCGTVFFPSYNKSLASRAFVFCRFVHIKQ